MTFGFKTTSKDKTKKSSKNTKIYSSEDNPITTFWIVLIGILMVIRLGGSIYQVVYAPFIMIIRILLFGGALYFITTRKSFFKYITITAFWLSWIVSFIFNILLVLSGFTTTLALNEDKALVALLITIYLLASRKVNLIYNEKLNGEKKKQIKTKEQTFICSDCGKKISSTDTECPRCGTKFKATISVKKTAKKKTAKNSK